MKALVLITLLLLPGETYGRAHGVNSFDRVDWNSPQVSSYGGGGDPSMGQDSSYSQSSSGSADNNSASDSASDATSQTIIDIKREVEGLCPGCGGWTAFKVYTEAVEKAA